MGGVSVRVLVIVLAVQLLLAALIIWAAATGFSFLHGVLGTSHVPSTPGHATPGR